MLKKLAPNRWEASVPSAMRSLPRWVGHRSKKPIRLDGRGAASVVEEATWGTFEDACRFYRQHYREPDVGVGFVFNRDGMVFLDLDNATEEDGTWKPWATKVLAPLVDAAFIERSPGGRGLHAFVIGALPVDGARAKVEDGAVEAYTAGRYSTVTGVSVGFTTELDLAVDELNQALAPSGLLERLERPREPRAPAEPERLPEVLSALEALDPDMSYGDWLTVGMAMSAGLGDEGLPAWVEWSSRGAKHVPGEPERKWDSFRREDGVGLGTLFKMAEEAGWQPPWLRGKDLFADVEPEDADRAVEEGAIPYHTTETKSGGLAYVRGVENVMLFFDRDPSWAGRVRMNVREGLCLDGKPLSDKDLVALSAAVSRALNWSPAVAKDMLRDGLQAAGEARQYDPVVEWLDGLKWDKVHRMNRLASVVGLEDTPLTQRYLRRWLVGAVARAMRPGCEMQNMLVLSGPQGVGKSRLFKALAVRPEWYRESHVVLGDKDAQLAVLRPWLVEVGELSGMTKAEVDKVKVFISETEGSFRRPYGMLDERHPRRCVFAGTTNEETFLRDATGSRRQWVVLAPGAITLPDPAFVEGLWAEAVAAYKAGEVWWETPAELHETLTRGEEFLAETTLDIAVQHGLRTFEARGTVTAHELLEHIREQGVHIGSNLPLATVSHAMKRAGWLPHRAKLDGRVHRLWKHGSGNPGKEAVVLALNNGREKGLDNPAAMW